MLRLRIATQENKDSAGHAVRMLQFLSPIETGDMTLRKGVAMMSSGWRDRLAAAVGQAAGINPILVQEMLGHTTLEMTSRYTHLGIETKREALQRLLTGQTGAGDNGKIKNAEETTQECASEASDG
jgi:hypothetical protein